MANESCDLKLGRRDLIKLSKDVMGQQATPQQVIRNLPNALKNVADGKNILDDTWQAIFNEIGKTVTLTEENKNTIKAEFTKLVKGTSPERDAPQADSVESQDAGTTTQQQLNLTIKKQFVNILGGQLDLLQDQVELEFRQRMASALFFDLFSERRNDKGQVVGYGHIVYSPTVQNFNYNVYKLQDQLFQQLVKYILELNLGSESLRTSLSVNNSLFIKGFLNDNLQEVLETLLDYINLQKVNGTHESILKEGFKIKQSLGFLNSTGNAKYDPSYKYYTMVQAWLELRYFDDLLEKNVSNISTSKLLKNVFPSSNKQQKYYPKLDKSGRYTGYSMDDLRNGFSEAGKFSKMLLSALPIIKYNGAGLTGQVLDLPKLTQAMGKLRQIAMAGILNNKTFDSYVLNVLGSPREYMYNILRTMFEKNSKGEQSAIVKNLLAQSSIDFSDQDLNVLYTLWTHVYNPNPKNQASLMKLENGLVYASSINMPGYSLVDCVTSLIFRVANIRYFNVHYDEEEGQVAEVRKNYVVASDIVIKRNLLNLRFRASSQQARSALLGQYRLNQEVKGKTISIKLNDRISVKITNNNKDKWFLDSTRNDVSVIVDGKETNIDKWFKELDFSFLSSDPDDIKKSEAQQDVETVLQFIQDTLGINLMSKQGFATMYLYNISNPSKQFTDLVDAAGRYLLNTQFMYNYTTSNTDLSLLSYLQKQEPDWYGMLADSSKRVRNNYIIQRGEDNYMLTAGHRGLHWLDDFVSAEQQLLRSDSKMTLRNFEGKQEQAGKTNFLGNELPQQINRISIEVNNNNNSKELLDFQERGKQAKKDGKLSEFLIKELGKDYGTLEEGVKVFKETKMKRVATRHNLFVGNPTLLKSTFIQTDMMSPYQRLGSVKDMSEPELIINAIFQQFWGSYYSGDVNLKGSLMIQPTTYSDKTTILSYLINTGANVEGIKDWTKITRQELAEKLKDTLGKYYEDLIYNILFDWNKIFQEVAIDKDMPIDKCESLVDIEKTLRILDEDIFYYISIAQKLGIELIDELHYVRKGNKILSNELLHYYYNTFNTDQVYKFLDKERENFVNNLLSNDILISYDSPICDDYLSHIIDTKKWVDKDSGYIIIAKIKDGNTEVNVFDQNSITLQPGQELIINPLFDSYFNAWNLIASNIRMAATGTELVHPYDKAKSPDLSLDPSKNPELIDAYNILGIDALHIPYSWTEYHEIVQDKLESLAHPDATADETALMDEITRVCLPIYEKAMTNGMGIEGAQGNSLKRNVILPGTAQLIDQQKLQGSPNRIKIAIFEDIKAPVNQFNGKKQRVDSCDGSSFIGGLQNQFENTALEDQEVGVDVKNIHQGFNPTYGVTHFSKYAAYCITNNRMRNTLMSNTSLYNLHRRMHNMEWRDSNGNWTNSRGVAIDLVDGKRIGYHNYGTENQVEATDIDFRTDILQRQRLFYKSGKQHYQIEDLKKKYISRTNRNIQVEGNVIKFFQGKQQIYEVKLNDNNHASLTRIVRVGEEEQRAQDATINYKTVANIDGSTTYVLYNSKDMYEFTVVPNNKVTTIYAIKDSSSAQFNFIKKDEGEIIYYTRERQVQDNAAYTSDEVLTRLQMFDANNEQHKFNIGNGELSLNGKQYSIKDFFALNQFASPKTGNLHTINSLFELHSALGGIYCESLVDKSLIYSEDNFKYLANYANVVSGQDKHLSDETLLIQKNYYQPLKEMYIAYATNKTAMKHGVGNLNPASRWSNSDKLTWLEVDSIILGTQGDYDHKADEAEMSLPTQVMTALAQGGNLYEISDQIYRAVGIAALNAVKVEMEVFQKYIKTKDWGKLYDLVGRICIEHMGSNSTSLDLSEALLKGLEDEFNLNLSNHEEDFLKIPFSDPSIFGHLVPTIINIINTRAIKPKNPGLGMIMVPSYGMQQIWEIDGEKYTNYDLAELVEDSDGLTPERLKQAIQEKLQEKQAEIPFVTKYEIYYDLESVINVKRTLEDGSENVETITIKSLDDWLAFDEENWEHFGKQAELTGGTLSYQYNCIQGRDLAPKRISITYDEVDDTGETRTVTRAIYSIPRLKQAIKENETVPDEEMNVILDDLKNNGRFKKADGNYQKISDYHIYRAETIVSNMWTKQFGVSSQDSLLQVKKKLDNLSRIKQPIDLGDTVQTVNFISNSGNTVRVTTQKLNKSLSDKNIRYQEIKLEKLKTEQARFFPYNVYYNSGDQQLLTGVVIERSDLDPIQNKSEISKNKNIMVQGNKVYEYIQFIYKYNITFKHKSSEILYRLDTNAIQRAVSTIDSKTKGAPTVKSITRQLITQLYHQDSYIGVTTSDNYKADPNINDALTNLKQEFPSLDYLNSYLKADKTNKDQIWDDYLKKEVQKAKVSFNMSLQLVSSRIPSQNLQSFMGMEVVGFSQMDTNVAYVPASQTFLQGSDYDIDKAYMMTYYFNDMGQFITWSPLFSLDSEEELQASTYLPLPEDIYIGTLDSNNEAQIKDINYTKALEGNEEKALNNTKQIREILDKIIELNSEPGNKAKVIRKYADLLELMHKLKTDVDYNKVQQVVFIKWNDDDPIEEYEEILDNVRTHQQYTQPAAIAQQALQNSYTSKIILVAEDLANVNAASTAITMEDARATTVLSSANNKVRTLFDPVNVLHMQYENLSGKIVISVAANGEKGFFTLYQYYTTMYHAIQQQGGNSELYDYLRFSKTFDRVKGRWDKRMNKGEIQSVTVSQIANLNPKLIEALKDVNGASLTDEEIKFEVSNMISQLLSAATDNAKELILAKINASVDYAKMYFYLLTLGFSINDIAAFMTCGASELIIKYSQSNIFKQEALYNKSDSIVDFLLNGKLRLEGFLGDYLNSQFFKRFKAAYSDTTYSQKFLSMLYDPKVTKEDITNFMIKVLQTPYVKGEFVEDGVNITDKRKQDITRFVIWFSKIKDHVNSIIEEQYDGKVDTFKSDIKEFDNIMKGANELTTLVQTFLNSNQGLPTTTDKLLHRLDQIESAINDREDLMQFLGADGKTVSVASCSTKEQLYENLPRLLASIQTDPNLITPEKIEKLKELNDKHKFIGKFSVDKWLMDEEYRNAITYYYNMIKHSFNIFHLIDNHPSYRVNMEKLLPLAFGLVYNSNFKFGVVRALRDHWKSANNGYFESKALSKVVKVANKIMIRSFLEDMNISVPIDPSWTVLQDFRERKQNGGSTLEVSTRDGYSSFKYVMDKYIIPELKNRGKFLNTEIVENNAFLDSLIMTEERGQTFYKLDIDMNSTSNYSIYRQHEIISGFNALRDIRVPGFEDVYGRQYNLRDLFILYNLVVHQNYYGKSTLTSLFKAALHSKDTHNLLYQYESFIGELDKDPSRFNKNLDQYEKDLAMEIAPYTSEYFSKYHIEPYIKISKNGLTILQEKEGNNYKDVSIVPLDGLNSKQKSEILDNLAQYGSLISIGRDETVSLVRNLQSGVTAQIARAFIDLMQLGKLVIVVNC